MTSFSKWIVGIVGSLIAAAVCAGITAHVTTREELTELRQQIIAMQADKERDAKQDESIHKHWKFLGWTRQHINKLYQMNGFSIPDEPDLQ